MFAINEFIRPYLHYIHFKVAEVIEYLHVQVSSISCRVVSSILALHIKMLTQQLLATGGLGWVEHHVLNC